MAACQDDFSSLAFGKEAIVLAIRLAEALRSDEVEIFLEIYDSIPSSTEIKRVDEIKEMARQLAALPKKQFEIYRSKKILSNDHAFLWQGGTGSSQVIKDKLNTSFIGKSFIDTLEKDLNVLQNQVEVLDTEDPVSGDTKPKSRSKRKRVKSKKGKLATSVTGNAAQPGMDSNSNGTGRPNTNSTKSGTGQRKIDSAVNGSGVPHGNNVDMKHKTLFLENCAPLHVSLNTNLVADISIRRESEADRSTLSSKTDLAYCGSSSSNDSGIVTPKELFLNDDIKEVDSGLGSYASPVFVKEPPFGFPPSSQRLLESALGLLPSVALEKNNSPNSAKPSETSGDFFEQTEDFKGGHVVDDKNLNCVLKQNVEICNCNHSLEDDPISDVSDSKEVCKDFVVVEGDSVDGDVSSSSAVEDEGGWQSQSRSYRRRRKEPVARANREKQHMDKFQGKDCRKQQSESQFKKNYNRKKSVDNKRNHSRASENVLQNTENKRCNAAGSSAVPTNVDGQIQEKNFKDSTLQAMKGLNLTSDKKLDSQKGMSATQKVLSYRDVLLKGKNKAEPAESSDSGVDANSVSSCELSSSQLEMQGDSFNKQQCVDYLRNAWKKVMFDAKQGLVIYFSVDSDPVFCENKRRNRSSGKRVSSSKSQ